MSRSVAAAAAAVVASILSLALLAPVALGAEGKPVVAGNLTFNPQHVVAVYRPVPQGAIAIYLGRPGQNIQTIVIRDSREAAAVFDELWRNEKVTKSPGDDDGRPLTRMLTKEAEGKTPTLIVNVERVSAIVYDARRRVARVYLDRLDPLSPLLDPNADAEVDHLAIQDVRDEGEMVAAAYKACVLGEARR
jgi:hypothetical protein